VRLFGFWIKINEWRTGPIGGLRPHEALVNDTVDRLPLLGIHGKKAINPANGTECAVIDVQSMTLAEGAGLTTWSAVDYLVLATAAVLRRRSACFLDVTAAAGHLDALAQAFPALVDATRAKYTDVQIARVLRDRNTLAS